MPQGSAISEGSSGEGVSHFAAIRIRVVGTGPLELSVSSLDDVRSKTLAPVTMASSVRMAQTRLVNFVDQRASFTISTTASGAKFRINRIVIFSKEIYSSFPGN